ncbi:uncharacterized protein [Periplaneta americana]|uniref:uncharacterized protein n=1 Tax=Periplaneta americana TaxID=6978 RepID=UPI0037E82B49
MRGFHAVTAAAILVVFSMQTAHSHHHSKELPTCPEDEHGEIILFPKPENCSEFYQCAGGHLHTHHCPPDLYYCAAKEYCDYLYNCDYSNCQMTDTNTHIHSKAEQPLCDPGEPTGVTYYPNPENCSNFYACETGILLNMQCPQGLLYCSEKSACTWSWDKECAFADCIKQPKLNTLKVSPKEEFPSCPPPTGGYATLISNPDNCDSYYECDNMVPILMSCPSDLYFCSEKSTCSWLWDKDCSHSDCKILGKSAHVSSIHEAKQQLPSVGKADAPVCKPPGQSPDVEYYPNPENCSNYYECDNGLLHDMQCPQDLVFCSEKSACTWSWDKECAFADCIKQEPKLNTHNVSPKEELPTCPPPIGGYATLMSNPENCDSYYECDNMVPILMSCPPDLYFCSEKSTCSWLWDKDCSHSDCKILGKSAHVSSIHEAKQQLPSVGKADAPVCKPPGQSPDVEYYPNSENCSNYYECDNGILHNMECPQDLVFCSEKSACTWSWDKECAFADCIKQEPNLNTHKVSPKEELPTCPAPTGGYATLISNPENCDSYYECDNMVPILMSCPPDLYFCSEKITCSWLWDKDCSHSDCKILGRNAHVPSIHEAKADAPVCKPPGQSPDVEYYPNPENCSNYYECDNGILHNMQCPQDLVFCSEKSACTWSWDKECAFADCIKQELNLNTHNVSPKEELPTCPPPTGGNATLIPNPDNCDSYYECDNMVPILMSCPPDLYFCSEKSTCSWLWDKDCSHSDCKILGRNLDVSSIHEAKADQPVCKPPGQSPDVDYYPNPENCSNYYECDNGLLHDMQCPQGLVFCSEKSACTWSWDKECAFVDCIKQEPKLNTLKVSPKEELPTCPPPTGGNATLIPNPDNCDSYYECDNMVPVLMSCPPDLYFCSEKSTCSWLWDKDCSHSDCKILGRNAHVPSIHEAKRHLTLVVKASQPVCKPPGQSPNVDYYPNPENCSNYYECDNGILHDMQCPQGLLFCSEKLVCTWSWDKECAFDECTITT